MDVTMMKVEVVTLGTTHFQEANAEVRAALQKADVVQLHEVFAQRYLGCAMGGGKRLEIFGTPGNDLACYLDGGSIEVYGNAQDQVGNTMNAGSVVVHGRCGDAAGYAMRGGSIFVRDDCGWRAGINMKQYEAKCPTLVIGGNAGSFLGEYMAGGVIVLLGQPGEYLATGMHGGVMYVRASALPEEVPAGLVAEPLNGEDRALLAELLGEYNRLFADELPAPLDVAALLGQPVETVAVEAVVEDGRVEALLVEETVTAGDPLVALRPASSRPYAALYAN